MGILIFLWSLGFLYTLGIAASMGHGGERKRDIALTYLLIIFAWPLVLGGLRGS